MLTRKQEHRATANARHIAPPGAMSLATERLIERTPEKYRREYAQAAADGDKRPEHWLNHNGAFSRAGRDEPVAYAGGAIIAHLPRRRTGRGFHASGPFRTTFRSPRVAPERVRTHQRLTLAEIRARMVPQGKASKQAKKELREQLRQNTLADIRVLLKELCG